MIVLGIIMGSYLTVYYLSEETVSITVHDKERATQGSGQQITSKYIVYAVDETFENTDEVIYFKFNSMDLQRQLVKGNSYKVKVIGWRIPFLSMTRNIISITDTLNNDNILCN